MLVVLAERTAEGSLPLLENEIVRARVDGVRLIRDAEDPAGPGTLFVTSQ